MKTVANVIASRSSALAVVIVCVVYARGMMLVSASEASVRPEPESRLKEVQTPRTPGVEQWRRHPSYQVFDSQAVLPSITVAAKGTLGFGGQAMIGLDRAAQMPVEQRKAIAAQFEVPETVLFRFLQLYSTGPKMEAEQAAKELRTLIIDYRYLHDQWNRYQPLPGQVKIKRDALESLQAGDLDKVWEMFLALPRPAPPSRLQVMAIK